MKMARSGIATARGVAWHPIRQEYARPPGHSAGALIHALLKTVPYFVGPLFPDFPQTRFKKDGPTPAAAAWLDVAVSRAEFVRAFCIGLTSAVERIADLGRTSRDVRKVPISDINVLHSITSSAPPSSESRPCANARASRAG